MDDLVVGDISIPASEIEEIFHTHGGPGGQHANRTRSAVRLRFAVDRSSLPEDIKARLTDRLGQMIEVSASESRSQFRNRALARRRLMEKLSEALSETRPRRETRPTRTSKERRLAKKRARSELKRQRRRPDIE